MTMGNKTFTVPTVYGRAGEKVHWPTAWAQPMFPGKRRLANRSAFKAPVDVVDMLSIFTYVYDVVLDSPFVERMAYVSERVTAIADPNMIWVEPVKVRSVIELAVCQQMFLGRGAEATWLRYGTQGYEKGPSQRLLTVDTFLRGEFEVVDYKLGRGKWAGVPILVCETTSGENFDVLSPGPNGARRDLLPQLHTLRGRKVIVRYKALSADETPVLPVATGWVK
jgi:hypothetical protein